MNQELQTKILEKIVDERIRQINKWGPQYHDDSTWSMILMEEVGEVAKSIVDSMQKGDRENNLVELKKEIIQVAAVAVAWLECIESTK